MMVKAKGVRIGMAALALLVLGGADGKGCKTEKKAKDDGPPIDVTARQLYEDYKANEVSADEKYRDRTLRVTGKVTEIKKDFTDEAYVLIGVGQSFDNVRARFKDDAALGSLKRGQSITVRCVGDNVIMGSPKIASCVLE